MAAAEIVINQGNLQKLESFLNDTSYREAIENSCNFNSRLCAERRMRMPFLDPQTGVAQNHCNLFMSRKQRMPGAREGQIYTYPSQRWRKARRQYLTLKTARWGWLGSADSSCAPDGSNSLLGIPSGLDADGVANSSGPLSVDATADTDSRDGSQAAGVSKDDMSKEWFYDELAMDELDALDDPPTPESDSDYCEDSYSARKRTGTSSRGGAARSSSSSATAGNATNISGSTPPSRGPGRRAGARAKEPSDPEVTPTKGRGGKSGGRGRRKAAPPVALPYEVPGDSDKPFGCELCGARYKTRPGLTYHYSHSHKEGGAAAAGGVADVPSVAEGSNSQPAMQANPPAAQQVAQPGQAATQPSLPHHEYQDSYVTFLNNPSSAAGGAAPRRSRPNASSGTSGDGEVPMPPLPTPATEPSTSASAGSASEEDEDAEGDGELTPPATRPSHAPPTNRRPGDKASPSPYCDFCLGDQLENKKTGTPEELVSCSDCGRSGKQQRTQSSTGNGYARFACRRPNVNGLQHKNGFKTSHKSILMQTLRSPARMHGRGYCVGKTNSTNVTFNKSANADERIPKIISKDDTMNGHNVETEETAEVEKDGSHVLMHSTSYSADDFDSFVTRAMMTDEGKSPRVGVDRSSSPSTACGEDDSRSNDTSPSPPKRDVATVERASAVASIRRSARSSTSNFASKRGRKKRLCF